MSEMRRIPSTYRQQFLKGFWQIRNEFNEVDINSSGFHICIDIINLCFEQNLFKRKTSVKELAEYFE